MRKTRELLTPDITPLIDIVFILLIFFIVSSVFKKEDLALNINLPSANAKEIEIKVKEISVEISVNYLAFLGKKVSLEQFEINLSNISNTNKPIILRIDKDVKYQRVVLILDLLQKYSLNNLALVTQEL